MFTRPCVTEKVAARYELLRGDLNSDGILTPVDAAIALRLAATGAQDPAADVSGDPASPHSMRS